MVFSSYSHINCYIFKCVLWLFFSYNDLIIIMKQYYPKNFPVAWLTLEKKVRKKSHSCVYHQLRYKRFIWWPSPVIIYDTSIVLILPAMDPVAEVLLKISCSFFHYIYIHICNNTLTLYFLYFSRLFQLYILAKCKFFYLFFFPPHPEFWPWPVPQIIK